MIVITFAVEIKEILVRTITTEAATPEEALEAVEHLYDAGEYILDSGDFVNVSFSVTTSNGTCLQRGRKEKW